jgi:hypothetical protein
MGSTLSIHNNTSDTVLIKIGDDQEAVRIAGICATAFTAVSLTVTGAGWAAGALTGGVLTISASSAMVAAGTALSLSNVTRSVATEIRDSFTNNGYHELKPNQTHTSSKKTLSLWQQCHVVRIRTDRAGTVIHEETYMRPIFTGATDNSNLQHDISFWIHRYPYVEKIRTRANVVNQASNVALPRNRCVLTSSHGTKLRCNQDGSVDLAPHAREWEQWEQISRGGNKYNLRSYHGTYLRARQDGTVDGATHAQEWEEWTLLRYRSGNVWRSHHGTYLSGCDNGSVTTMPHIQLWEKWN